ncbi:MAG: hypothetical protein LAO08_20165 [Acidobacteriia bacterium]|nr:hypothetical protein [Terriglobia bacterium]
MKISGWQMLYRVELRLASEFAEQYFAEGRTPWTRGVIHAWSAVHLLRTGERYVYYDKENGNHVVPDSRRH